MVCVPSTGAVEVATASTATLSGTIHRGAAAATGERLELSCDHSSLITVAYKTDICEF